MPTCCNSCGGDTASVTVVSVPTPPEIVGDYKIDPAHLATPDFATDLESWLKQQAPYDGPALPQPQNMLYTSGTTGIPRGCGVCADAGSDRER
jgi:long-chain acyl-CoA synthetase